LSKKQHLFLSFSLLQKARSDHIAKKWQSSEKNLTSLTPKEMQTYQLKGYSSLWHLYFMASSEHVKISPEKEADPGFVYSNIEMGLCFFMKVIQN
jgi:hypothetical protein